MLCLFGNAQRKKDGLSFFPAAQFYYSSYKFGYGFGAGMGWNDWSLKITSIADDGRSLGIMGDLSWEMPGRKNHFSPFVSLVGGYEHLFEHIRINNKPIGSKFYSAQLQFGLNIRIWENLKMNQSFGFGYGLWYMTDRDRPVGRGLSSGFSTGLIYDIHLHRPVDRGEDIEHPFQNGFRHSFTLNTHFLSPEWLSVTPISTLPDFNATYGFFVNRWLQVNGGITVGKVPSKEDLTQMTTGYKGWSLGLRAYPVQKEHWSYFTEVSYHYQKFEDRYMWLNHVHIGNYISFRILENLDAFGGFGFNIYEDDWFNSVHIGMTLSPFGK